MDASRPASGPLLQLSHRVVSVIILLLMLGVVFPAATPALGDELEAQPRTPALAEAWERFERADAALTAAVKALGEDELRRHLDDVDSWPRYRHERARVMGAGGIPELDRLETDARSLPRYWLAAEQLTRTRIAVVRGLIAAGDEPLRWAGRWIDGYGGTLLIIEQDDTLLFALDVVRGPTAHLGHIAGRARVNRTLARFSDRGNEPEFKGEDEGETWINFHRRWRTLDLEAVNTGHYHGARAYFHGRYVRVGDLTRDEVAKVNANVIGEVYKP